MSKIRIEKCKSGYFVYNGDWLEGFCWTLWGAKWKAKRVRKNHDSIKKIGVVWEENA